MCSKLLNCWKIFAAAYEWVNKPKETQQNFQQQIIKKPKSVQITYTSMLFEHWCPNNIHERFIPSVRVQPPYKYNLTKIVKKLRKLRIDTCRPRTVDTRSGGLRYFGP